MRLRDYQEEALASVKEAYSQGTQRVLICLATGLGKTVLIAALPLHIKPKANDAMVVLVNRDELVSQTVDKLEKVHPGGKIGVEKAQSRASADCDFIVASVQTLHEKRLDDFYERFGERIGILMIDECHHSTAASYRRITDRLFQVRPDGLLVGVTATPQRSDGEGLGIVFDRVVFHRDMRWAINNGYLVPVQSFKITSSVNLDEVKTIGGDFAIGDLAEVIDTTTRNDLAVSAYVQHAFGKKAIAFCSTIKHAEHLSDAFNQRGVKAAWASGNNSKDERNTAIEKFKKGEVLVLVNCALFIEGFDVPATEVMIDCRPTQSSAMYCLDMKTEILTNSGWKNYEKMSKNEVVAVYNDGIITWEEITSKIKRKTYKNERFISIKSPSMDARITEKHNLLMKRYSTSKDFTGYEEKFSKYYAKKALKGTKFNVPVSGFEYIEDANITDDEIRFIGLWITDGTINKKTRQISIAQPENRIINSYIIKTIEECGFDYLIYRSPHNSMFNQTSTRLRYVIRKRTTKNARKNIENGKFFIEQYLDKNGSNLLKKFSHTQLRVLLEAMNVENGRKSRKVEFIRKTYKTATNNKIFADFIQEICIPRGLRCNISTLKNKSGNNIYMIYITDTQEKTVTRDGKRPSFIREDYKFEDVWCVETPSKTIITRRNGKVLIMGNCQMTGRILRPLDEVASQLGLNTTVEQRRSIIANSAKPIATVLDIVDQTRKHNLVSLPTLYGLPPKFDASNIKIDKAVEDFQKLASLDPAAAKEVKSYKEIITALERVEVFAIPVQPPEVVEVSSMAWRMTGEERYRLSLPVFYEAKTLTGQPIKNFARKYRAKITEAKRVGAHPYEDFAQKEIGYDAKSLITIREAIEIQPGVMSAFDVFLVRDQNLRILGSVDNFHDAFHRAEGWIEHNRGDLTSALSAKAPWRDKELTKNQMITLKEKFGVPLHLIPVSRGEASQLITKLVDEKRWKPKE